MTRLRFIFAALLLAWGTVLFGQTNGPPIPQAAIQRTFGPVLTPITLTWEPSPSANVVSNVVQWSTNGITGGSWLLDASVTNLSAHFLSGIENSFSLSAISSYGLKSAPVSTTISRVAAQNSWVLCSSTNGVDWVQLPLPNTGQITLYRLGEKTTKIVIP